MGFFAQIRSRWMRPWGIRSRAALLSWLVTAVTLTLFILVLIPYQRGLLIDRLESAAEVAATSIAEVTVSSIVVESYGTVVDHCLQVVSERPAVRYIVVTRADGFSFIHTENSWRYADLSGDWTPPVGAGRHGEIRESDLVTGEVYHYTYPLRYSGIDWGWIHIGLSVEDFYAGEAETYRLTAALGLFCLFVSFVASIIFARQFAEPLRALTESADRVARGDLTVSARVSGTDEVGQLAQSFNQMTAALLESRDNLEAIVVARTAELRESEERWRSLVENAPDVILTVDPDLEIRFVSRDNPIFSVGARVADCVAESHRDDVILALRSALQEGAAQTLEVRQGLVARPDISTVFRIGPILHDGECVALILIATDVTERVNAEERIIHLERLGALGEMAAGVSHNLNNILTGIMGPSQLLAWDVKDPELARHAQDIYKASERAADLVHRLHQSTRGVHDDQLTAVSLNEVIEEVVRTARSRWKDEPESRGITIDVQQHLSRDLAPVRGTASGLHDMVLNLLLNAIEAMKSGGTVSFTTKMDHDRVVLIAADSGIGMSEETRRRVFQPFFTTRKDVGSGLGLATCYATVSRWGGSIDVSSEIGKGSTFTVRLPSTTAGNEQTQQVTTAVSTRRGQVLIVDDEPSIRQLLSHLLEAEHDVEVAADGTEALDLATAFNFDVAIIDLGIPGVPGDRVARRMREIDPRVVTILITGWELAEDDERRAPFDVMLQKPLRDMQEVKSVVRRGLAWYDERQARGPD